MGGLWFKSSVLMNEVDQLFSLFEHFIFEDSGLVAGFKVLLRLASLLLFGVLQRENLPHTRLNEVLIAYVTILAVLDIVSLSVPVL